MWIIVNGRRYQIHRQNTSETRPIIIGHNERLFNSVCSTKLQTSNVESSRLSCLYSYKLSKNTTKHRIWTTLTDGNYMNYIVYVCHFLLSRMKVKMVLESYIGKNFLNKDTFKIEFFQKSKFNHVTQSKIIKSYIFKQFPKTSRILEH